MQLEIQKILTKMAKIEKFDFLPGFPEDDPRTASQNALLKQLLANSLMAGGAGRPAGTPFSEV